MSGFDDLYQEIIMDHYRRPRGRAALDHVPEAMRRENPACGDSIKLEVIVGSDSRLTSVRFDGQGCAISTASASMMTESVRGLTVEQARERATSFIKALSGGCPLDALDGLGDCAAFKSLARFPVRLKCATLAWHALLTSLPPA